MEGLPGRAPTFLANASTRAHLEDRLLLAKREASEPCTDFPFALHLVTFPAFTSEFAKGLSRARSDYRMVGREREPGPARLFASLEALHQLLRRCPCATEPPVGADTNPSRLIGEVSLRAMLDFLAHDPIFAGVFLGLLRIKPLAGDEIVLGLEPRFLVRALGRRISESTHARRQGATT